MMSYSDVGFHTEDSNIHWLKILLIILDNLKLVVLLPLLVSALTFGYTYTITPIYTATTTLLPVAVGNASSGAGLLLGQITGGLGLSNGGFRTPTEEYLSYLGSLAIHDVVIKELDLQRHFGTDNNDLLRQKLQAAIKATVDKKSGLIMIEASDVDPKFAAKLANVYVQALRQIKAQISVAEARDRRLRLEQELQEARQTIYQSSSIREAVIQSLIREYEMAGVEQRRNGPYIAQLDEAEAPKFNSKPKRVQMVMVSLFATLFIVLAYIFLRHYLNQFLSVNPDVRLNILNLIRRQN